MIRRPPRSTLAMSSAASDVYKRQELFTAASRRLREFQAVRQAASLTERLLFMLTSRSLTTAAARAEEEAQTVRERGTTAVRADFQRASSANISVRLTVPMKTQTRASSQRKRLIPRKTQRFTEKLNFKKPPRLFVNRGFCSGYSVNGTTFRRCVWSDRPQTVPDNTAPRFRFSENTSVIFRRRRKIRE